MADTQAAEEAVELIANATNATLRFWELNSSQIMVRLSCHYPFSLDIVVFLHFIVCREGFLKCSSAVQCKHTCGSTKELEFTRLNQVYFGNNMLVSNSHALVFTEWIHDRAFMVLSARLVAKSWSGLLATYHAPTTSPTTIQHF